MAKETKKPSKRGVAKNSTINRPRSKAPTQEAYDHLVALEYPPDPALSGKNSFLRRYIHHVKVLLLLFLLVVMGADLWLVLTYQPAPKNQTRTVQLAGVSLVNSNK